MAYYRLYVVGGFDPLRNTTSAMVESLDPFGCEWRREADLPSASAEVGVTGWGGGGEGGGQRGEAPHLKLCAVGGWEEKPGRAEGMAASQLPAPQGGPGLAGGGSGGSEGRGGSGGSVGRGAEDECALLCQCATCARIWRGQGGVGVGGWRTVEQPACAWEPAANSVASSRVYTYDSKSNAWSGEGVRRLPAGRAGAGVVSLGGRIYVCGGSDGAQAVATVWSLDPSQAGADWQHEASLQQARCSLAAATVAVHDEHGQPLGIMVCGGRSDAGVGRPCAEAVLNSVEFYSLASRSWRWERPLRSPRYKVAACSHAGRTYVVGGLDCFGTPSLDVYSLRPGDKYWREEPALRRARGGHVAAVLACPTALRSVTPEPDSSDSERGVVSWATGGLPGYGGREAVSQREMEECVSEQPVGLA